MGSMLVSAPMRGCSSVPCSTLQHCLGSDFHQAVCSAAYAKCLSGL